MIEPGREADLAEETLGAAHGAKLGVEDLDCHLAVMPDVDGQVDRGHATAAELTVDGIPVGEGVLEAGQCIGHVYAR